MNSDDIKICTSGNPMPEDADREEWKHPDAVEISSEPAPQLGTRTGQSVTYRCPHCTETYDVLVP